MKNRLFILTGVILFLMISFIILASETWKRDQMVRLISHAAKITEFAREMPFVAEQDKNPDEWKFFNYKEKLLPFVHIKKSIDAKKHYSRPFTIVMFHGSTWPLEYCYHEYKQMSTTHDIDLVSLEYPGFGARPGKTTENDILITYPEEVYHLIQHHLKIDWHNVILIGQCYGASAAIRLASDPRISLDLYALCLTKPLTSWHNVLDHSVPLLKHVMPNVLVSENSKYLEEIYCHLYIVQGEDDRICSATKAKEIFHNVSNCESAKFILVRKIGHSLSSLVCLNIIATSLLSDNM